MAVRMLITILLIGYAKVLFAQNSSYSPELLLGNRSYSYQHLVKYTFNNKLSINNLTLFDTEYENDANNIFFIRATASYNLYKNISGNVSLGVKNPGHFSTLSIRYSYTSNRLSVGYSVGATYQNGVTLEQSLTANYSPKLGKSTNAYINLLVIANTNSKMIERSLQQFRIGLIKNKVLFGFGMNLDQFKNATKTLENFGLFIKHKF